MFLPLHFFSQSVYSSEIQGEGTPGCVLTNPANGP